MNLPIFQLPGGMGFRNALIRCADGDANICLMFRDNLRYDIRQAVKEKLYSYALASAFLFHKTPEGLELKSNHWQGDIFPLVLSYSPDISTNKVHKS